MAEPGSFQMQPLAYPEGFKGFENFVTFFVDLLGMVPGCSRCFHFLSGREFRRVADHLNALLELRPAAPSEIWGSRQRADAAEKIISICVQHREWKNRNFIPADPLKVMLFWEPNDSRRLGRLAPDALFDEDDALTDIASAFHFELTNAVAVKLVAMNLGNVVDLCIQRQPLEMKA